IPESLRLLRARAELLALPVAERRGVLADPGRLTAAGMTWEAVAGWLQGPMDAEAWAAVIPSMGYMALLRNLRNFDEARIPDDAFRLLRRSPAVGGRGGRARALLRRGAAARRDRGGATGAAPVAGRRVVRCGRRGPVLRLLGQ